MSGMTRRNFLVGAGVCSCVSPSFAQFSNFSDDAMEVRNKLDSLFFLCSTPQITTVADQIVNYGSHQVKSDFLILPAMKNDNAEILPYATAQRRLRWRIEDTDTYRNGMPVVLTGFLDGSSSDRDYVKEVASEWLGYGPIIGFIDDASKANIRITFQGSTNKSAIGREALLTKGPTMHLPGVARFKRSDTSRRIILHEFGHGLMTMGHEHRHPDANFQFVPDHVIRDLINATPGNTGWTIAKVRTNITNPPYSRDRFCTEYDRDSIMHYPVQSSWITAGSPVPLPAKDLSSRDRECAKRVNT